MATLPTAWSVLLSPTDSAPGDPFLSALKDRQ